MIDRSNKVIERTRKHIYREKDIHRPCHTIDQRCIVQGKRGNGSDENRQRQQKEPEKTTKRERENDRIGIFFLFNKNQTSFCVLYCQRFFINLFVLLKFLILVFNCANNYVCHSSFSKNSISFYPQVMSNFKRRSTVGLSADFCVLNVLGFGCYTAYNASFFWSTTIHEYYKQRYGPNAEITVQSNDVAFAIHALILSSITLCQIAYYGDEPGIRSIKLSKPTKIKSKRGKINKQNKTEQ